MSELRMQADAAVQDIVVDAPPGLISRFFDPVVGPRRSLRNAAKYATATLSLAASASSSSKNKKVVVRHARKHSTSVTAKDEILGLRPSTDQAKFKRGFAPPEQYAHLQPLHDYLKEELDVLFCGINPGEKSAQVGHHFANPTNHFWRCLAGSQLTDRLLPPSEDFMLPEKYNLGLTDLVERPSKQETELAAAEFAAGVPALLRKVARFRPRIVCFVGKGIWEAFERALRVEVQVVPLVEFDASPSGSTSTGKSPLKLPRGRRRAGKSMFKFDVQPYKAVHHQGAVHETLLFVMPSTSGRVTSHQLPEKTALFALLKQRVEDLKRGNIDTSSLAVIPLPTLDQ